MILSWSQGIKDGIDQSNAPPTGHIPGADGRFGSSLGSDLQRLEFCRFRQRSAKTNSADRPARTPLCGSEGE
jgi:hypothetical protein